MKVYFPSALLARLLQVSIFTLFLVAALADSWPLRLMAQSPSPVEYERYDVDIQLEDDGDLSVRIRQRVRFDGEFERAFLEVPKDFTSGIEDIAVHLADGDALSPLSAELTDSPDAVSVTWTYPRTVPGDVLDFVIDYTAAGALWVYNDRDILRWDAIHADRSGVPVQSSRVTVRLPSYVPLDAVRTAAQGAPRVVERIDDAYVFTLQDGLPDGQFFNVELDFPHGLVNAAIQEWQKAVDTGDLQTDLERLDVRIWIKKNGTLVIREEMDVTVTAGVLYDAHREIKRLYLDDVTHLRVLHDDRPLLTGDPPCDECLVVSNAPRPDDWVRYDANRNQIQIDETRTGHVRADWFIRPAYPDQTARFAVEFAVRGAVRHQEDAQLFQWQVVPDFGIQPAATSLQICPPEGMPVRQLDVTHALASVLLRADAEGCLSAQSAEPLPPGELWDIEVTIPYNTVTSARPQWQADLESALAEQSAAAVARARRQLILAVSGIFSAVALLVGAIVAWFRWGRRRLREQLGGYVSEPPSGIAPGIVAYLADGAVRPNSLLASILQLATLGLIELDMSDGLSLRLRRTSEVSAADLRGPGDSHRTVHNTHLAYLFNRVVLPATEADKFSPLEELSASLQRALPEFYSAMAFDAQSYLLGRGHIRKHLLRNPLVLMLAWFSAAAIIIYSTFRFNLPSGISVFLVGATFVVFFTLHALRELDNSNGYTDLGAAERAKWIRFKKYLADLKRDGDLGAARQVMERYFAYAVALGVEQIVLAQVQRRTPEQPTWLAPSPSPSQPSPEHYNARQSVVQTAAPRQRPAASRRPPIVRRVRPASTLARLSHTLGASLEQTSASLGALLSTASGSTTGSPIQVTLKGAGGTRSMTWEGSAPVNSILDDILKQSMSDTRHAVAARERSSSTTRSRSVTRANSPSRSSGGFGSRHKTFGSSSGSRASSSSRSSGGSRSSSSGRRSGGGGRSGFG